MLPAIQASENCKTGGSERADMLSFVLFCHICSFQSAHPTKSKEEYLHRLNKAKVSILITKST